MALIKKRKINDPALKLVGDPNPNMLVTVTDKVTGITRTVELQDAVKNSGISLSSGVIGAADPSTTPDDTTNKFLKYSIANEAESIGTYQNFPTSSVAPFNPIEIAQEDLDTGIVELWGKNGLWRKNIIPVPTTTFAKSGGSPLSVQQIDNIKIGISDLVIELAGVNEADTAKYLKIGALITGGVFSPNYPNGRVMIGQPVVAGQLYTISGLMANASLLYIFRDINGANVSSPAALSTVPKSFTAPANAATIDYGLITAGGVGDYTHLQFQKGPAATAYEQVKYRVKQVKTNELSAKYLAEGNTTPTPVDGQNAANKDYVDGMSATILGKIGTPKAYPKNMPVICISCDDVPVSLSDQKLIDVCDKYGVKMGFAFIASDANIVNTQLINYYLDLQSKGHSILSHSTDGTVFTTALSITQAFSKLYLSSQRLNNLGFNASIFVSPSSTMPVSFLPLVAKVYSAAYTILNGGLNDRKQPQTQLTRFSMQSFSLQNVKDNIDNNWIAHNRIMGLYGHSNDFGTGIHRGEFVDMGTLNAAVPLPNEKDSAFIKSTDAGFDTTINGVNYYLYAYAAGAWTNDTTTWTVGKFKAIVQYCVDKRDAGEALFLSPNEAIKAYFTPIVNALSIGDMKGTTNNWFTTRTVIKDLLINSVGDQQSLAGWDTFVQDLSDWMGETSIFIGNVTNATSPYWAIYDKNNMRKEFHAINNNGTIQQKNVVIADGDTLWWTIKTPSDAVTVYEKAIVAKGSNPLTAWEPYDYVINEIAGFKLAGQSSGGGGNPFGQDLSATADVKHNSLEVGTLKAGGVSWDVPDWDGVAPAPTGLSMGDFYYNTTGNYYTKRRV